MLIKAAKLGIKAGGLRLLRVDGKCNPEARVDASPRSTGGASDTHRGCGSSTYRRSELELRRKVGTKKRKRQRESGGVGASLPAAAGGDIQGLGDLRPSEGGHSISVDDIVAGGNTLVVQAEAGKKGGVVGVVVAPKKRRKREFSSKRSSATGLAAIASFY